MAFLIPFLLLNFFLFLDKMKQPNSSTLRFLSPYITSLYESLANDTSYHTPRCVLFITGGGFLSLQSLLTTPGASKFVLEALVPYSYASSKQLLLQPTLPPLANLIVPSSSSATDNKPSSTHNQTQHISRSDEPSSLTDRSVVDDRTEDGPMYVESWVDSAGRVGDEHSAIHHCSAGMSRCLALRAALRAVELGARLPLGVGVSSSLRTNQPKEGEHKAYVTVMDLRRDEKLEKEECDLSKEESSNIRGCRRRRFFETRKIVLEKGYRDRMGEDDVVSQFVLCCIMSNTTGCHADHMDYNSLITYDGVKSIHCVKPKVFSIRIDNKDQRMRELVVRWLGGHPCAEHSVKSSSSSKCPCPGSVLSAFVTGEMEAAIWDISTNMWWPVVTGSGRGLLSDVLCDRLDINKEGENRTKSQQTVPKSSDKEEKSGYDVVVLSGSFNPIHRGHIRLANAAKEAETNALNRVVLELSCVNADKGTIGLADLVTRLELIRRCCHTDSADPLLVALRPVVVLTREAMFAGKVRLLRDMIFRQSSAGCGSKKTTAGEREHMTGHGTENVGRIVFALGYDTFERLLDKRYYGSSEGGMCKSLASMFAAGTDLVVASRDGLCVEQMDADRKAVCDMFGENIRVLSEFREDVSSTTIRNTTGIHNLLFPPV
eukprot:GHVQ01015590.1.p1 GENE.GHVQ01015590.1~~GHVQ01015590.1.p1  ORF type:complete len:658 (-),score=116.74 GHVQ01015590.1:207-2180(-)